MTSTALAIKMISRADADGLPADHELRTRAQAFEQANKGWVADPPTVEQHELVDSWARAKAAWHVYSGETAV